MHVIDTRSSKKKLVLPSVTYFQNLAFHDWRQLFSENMFSVLGWPHQVDIEPVAGGSMPGFVWGHLHMECSK